MSPIWENMPKKNATLPKNAKKGTKVSVELKQIILLHIYIFILCAISATSLLFFPYLSTAQQTEYFNLAISIILFIFPISLIISMFQVARRD